MKKMKHPLEELSVEALRHGLELKGEEFARHMDSVDPLRGFRERFALPSKGSLPSAQVSPEEGGAPCVYLCGNSLGLKPRGADAGMQAQLDKWASMAVEMHFEDPLPAALCDRYGREALGRLVGAQPSSVVLMNGLSVNLHLLTLAFYAPTPQRHRILVEGHAFPSDRYAMRSQLTNRGYDPEEGLLQLWPREGEDTLRTEDILEVLRKEGSGIALVCLSGVQYYTGQKFDMQTITQEAKEQGCVVGWDLAHAVGNVELRLDEWGVDFACWCSYKYLNSGPGSTAGAYVHPRHAETTRPGQLLGWWSNREETRFAMADHCDVAPGVDGFRLCNPSPFLASLVLTSLQIFDDAGMERVLAKQRLLTGHLEALLRHHFSAGRRRARILTPADPAQRGSQLSVEFALPLAQVHRAVTRRGVVCDMRQPSVMRLAPAPLYNSFCDVFRFVEELRRAFDDLEAEGKVEAAAAHKTEGAVEAKVTENKAEASEVKNKTNDENHNGTYLNGTTS